MNLYLFLILLFALQGAYWYIGRRSARQVKAHGDYFLAGKSVSLFPLMMTFLAGQVGGGLVLGAADEAFVHGWQVLLYPLGACLGLLALGLGLGRRLSEFKVSTVAQILEIAYNSPLLKRIASILSILSLFMILASQFIASHKFLLAMGISSPWIFSLFWGILLYYTIQGGLRAIIATDVAQGTVFSVVFCACFCFLFFNGKVPEFSPAATAFALSASKFTGWLLMPLLYVICGQDMGQRCFAGNSSRTVGKAALFASVGIMVVSLVPITFGVLAKNAQLDIPANSSTLILSINYAINPLATALVGCAVLAAIIGTAASLINAISSNLSQDFEIFRKNNNLQTTKFLTLLISLGALTLAFYFNNILHILIQSYELFVSALAVPIFIALFRKKGPFLAGLLSILFGMASFTLFKFITPPLPAEIVSLLLSLIGYGAGILVTKRQQRLLSPSI